MDFLTVMMGVWLTIEIHTRVACLHQWVRRSRAVSAEPEVDYLGLDSEKPQVVESAVRL